MKRNRKILIITCIVLAVPLGVVLYYYIREVRTVFDEPRTLSPKEETITVTYVNWACDCADFADLKNTRGEISEDSCIFIEPADTSLIVPRTYYDRDHFSKALQLTGHYYLHKGIPRSYDQKTPEKPVKARVFRYTKLQMVPLR